METIHQMTKMHLPRYAVEVARRHNIRPRDTSDQTAMLFRKPVGKRWKFDMLISPSVIRGLRLL